MKKDKKKFLKIYVPAIIVIILVLAIAFIPKNPTGQKEITSLEDLEVATFAGGCFWCVESAFEEYEGVYDAVSGYTGGEQAFPTYSQVSSGKTKHREAVEVYYDPHKISYEDLLEIFWRQIDPTDDGGSFVDRGFQYTSAIFYHSEEEKVLAEQSKQKLELSGMFEKEIVTKIIPATEFYKAEEYHQDYYKKNPTKYKFYRYGSGRDQYREKTWGEDKDYKVYEKFNKPSQEELKKTLTPLQYQVTQENATERPFNNEYWDNKEEGIYVDLISGEPLFSSKDKYVSGTGWPSFTKPLEPTNIVEKIDRKLIYPRTEIRSKQSDSHLGHLFNDGPEETGGLRYCMNSAALRFIPKENLEQEGYGEYLYVFE